MTRKEKRFLFLIQGIIVGLLLSLLFSSCTPNNNLDNRILRDTEGHYYLLEHQVGDHYVVTKLDSTQLHTHFKITEP